MAYWTDGSGRLQLELTEDETSIGSHQGDCEDDVRGLLALPHIAAQVNAWDMDDVRSNLLETGAWEEDELEDEEMCLIRTLWLACGDIADNPQTEDE